jgi:hypothetical protein
MYLHFGLSQSPPLQQVRFQNLPYLLYLLYADSDRDKLGTKGKDGCSKTNPVTHSLPAPTH